MAKILCVEDSPEFFMYLTSVLKDHSLVQASSINHALKLAQTGRDSFDLVLLDVSLPDGNGIKCLPVLRESVSTQNIPIIVLSSDNDVLTKVAAFGIGADDYVSKPPDPNELRARIAARLRNSESSSKNKSRIQIGDLTIDSDRMCVEYSSNAKGVVLIDLTPSEFKILKLVAGRPGMVFTRDQLIDHVWGVGNHITPRTVDAHVSHLRKKISESSVKIETVLSVGYKAAIAKVPTAEN